MSGSVVIWGGRIIDTQNRSGGTEITILEAPLDWEERPQGAETSRGRVIAKSSRFLDPAIYRKWRMITVAREIIGQEDKPLGESNYSYPVVKAEKIYLWEIYLYPPPNYYWWGWYGPYDSYF